MLTAQWLGTAASALLSLLLNLALARTLGPEAFGQYAALLSLGALLAIFQDGGYRTLLLRERVRATPDFPIGQDQLPRLALGHLLCSSALLLSLVALLPFARAELAATVLCFAAITLSQLASAHLRAAGALQRDALWQLWARLLSAALIVPVLLWSPAQTWLILLAWGSGLVLAFRLFPGRLRARPQLRPAPAALRAAVGFLWIDLATTLYHRMDLLILQQLLGADPGVGHYAAAFRLFDGTLLLAAPLALLFFRQIRLSDGAGARALLLRSLRWSAAAGLVLAAAAYLSGPWLCAQLFGEDYRGAGLLLGWIFLSFVLVLPNYVLTQWAIAAHQERWYGACAGCAALACLGLNLALVPAHGVLGSAWALLGTEAVLGLGLLGGVFHAARRDGRDAAGLG